MSVNQLFDTKSSAFAAYQAAAAVAAARLQQQQQEQLPTPPDPQPQSPISPSPPPPLLAVATADSDAAAAARQLLLLKAEVASPPAPSGSVSDDDGGGAGLGGEIDLPRHHQRLLHHRHQHQHLRYPSESGDASGSGGGSGLVVRTRRRKAGLPEDERFCVVCLEPASGYNFDRLTCESCKAFFRRNALKAREKIKPCSRGGGCDVSGPQRKHCPTCRLEKCLLVGMKKELILPPEKLEQRAKPKRRPRNPQSTSEYAGAGFTAARPIGGQQDARRRPSAVYLDHLLSGSHVHHLQQQPSTVAELSLAWSQTTLAGRTWSDELTPADEDCLAGLREAHSRLRDPLLLPEEAGAPGGGRLKEGVGRLEQAFNQMEACIRRIISVVKLIPIFNEADKEAQILMLKVNIYGLVIMYSSFFFNPATGSWEVPVADPDGDGSGGVGGVSLMRELAAAVAAVVGLRPGVSGLTVAELDQYCVNSHNVYAQLELHSRRDDLAKMLMLVLKLFNSDSMPASPARESVERAQSVYSQLLKKYLAHRFGVPDAMQLYPSLLLTFIDMRTVENKMVEFTKLLSVESLNPLVREFAQGGCQ